MRPLRTYPHATVYLVEDAPGTLAELKVSLLPVHSEELARRALREVAVLEQLTNPHVIKVLETGLSADEHWYILTEHLQGARLDEWHDFEHALAPTDALQFVHQACVGMAELHDAGIVHRELSPERLWVLPDRTLKILDFSYARSWGDEPTGDNVTLGRMLMANARYMAPEQITGEALGPATDVYTLGLMLYEMLSGYSPYFADEPLTTLAERLADDPGQWMRSHVSRPLVPLTSRKGTAKLPQRLVELVHRCLFKDAKRRPQSARELANELGWLLHHEFEATTAAVLHVEAPGTVRRYHLVLPGVHRVGGGKHVDLNVLGRDDVELGTLEWSGLPRMAEWVPALPAHLDGAPVVARVAMDPERRVEIVAGDRVVKVSLRYPAVRRTTRPPRDG